MLLISHLKNSNILFKDDVTKMSCFKSHFLTSFMFCSKQVKFSKTFKSCFGDSLKCKQSWIMLLVSKLCLSDLKCTEDFVDSSWIIKRLLAQRIMADLAFVSFIRCAFLIDTLKPLWTFLIFVITQSMLMTTTILLSRIKIPACTHLSYVTIPSILTRLPKNRKYEIFKNGWSKKLRNDCDKNCGKFFEKNCVNTFFYILWKKKSTKVDFSPISCKKSPFYTRNGHI